MKSCKQVLGGLRNNSLVKFHEFQCECGTTYKQISNISIVGHFERKIVKAWL